MPWPWPGRLDPYLDFLDLFFGHGDLERLLEGLRVSGQRVLDLLLGLLVLDLLFFDFSPGDLGDLDLVGLLDLILDLLDLADVPWPWPGRLGPDFLDFFFGNGDLERLLEGLRVSGLRVLDLLRLLVLDLEQEGDAGTVLSVFLLFRDLFRDSLSLAILAVWVG